MLKLKKKVIDRPKKKIKKIIAPYPPRSVFQKWAPYKNISKKIEKQKFSTAHSQKKFLPLPYRSKKKEVGI